MTWETIQPFVSGWLPAFWPTVIILAVIFIPGALILRLSGLRTTKSIVFSPVVSIALIGVGGVIFSAAKIAWSFAIFSIFTLVLALIAYLIGALCRRSWKLSSTDTFSRVKRHLPVWLGGLGVNAVLVTWLYARPAGSASSIAYSYDTLWHFSVIEWMQKTGDASSLHVGLLDGTNGSHFYPSAWHALVSMVINALGTPIEVAVQASLLAVLFVVWPLEIGAMTHHLFKGSRAITFVVLAFSSLVTVFPLGFLTFGLLYSNLLSYALLPACVLVMIRILYVLSKKNTEGFNREGFSYLIAFFSMPLAMAFAQPNSAFTLLVILLPVCYVALDSYVVKKSQKHQGILRVVAPVIFSLLLIAFWIVLHDSAFLGRTVAVDWPAAQSTAQASGEWLFFGNQSNGQIFLGLLALIGMVIALRERRNTWYVASYVLVGFFYVVCAGNRGGPGSFRDYLVGFWYHDATRLAAAGTVLALPFIANTLVTISRALYQQIHARFFNHQRPFFSVITVVLTFVSVLVTINDTSITQRRETLIEMSKATNDQWLSPHERKFLDKVHATIEPGAVVANNPFDGSTMAYSLAHVQVLFPALPGNWMGIKTPTQESVIEGLNTISSNSTACSAAKDLKIDYAVVLEHGARKVFQDGPNQFRGLRITDTTPGFTPILKDGNLRLYRLEDCKAH